jgi:F-type H+-transporting ATPase subunit a
MVLKHVKSLLVAAFGLFLLTFSMPSFASDAPGHEAGAHEAGAPKAINPSEVIMEHITDGHEFHFFTLGDFHATIPLPVILYSPERGLSVFMSSAFHHGHEAHNGYKLEHGHIKAVKEDGTPDEAVHVYDFSMTRNVVQMILALVILVVLMTKVAAKYKAQGGKQAPSGFQNMIEPVILFVRDEVGKTNLGHKYEKYMPYLLTVFFFILINNLFGLIPGSANVTGNIALTGVLALISFVVIIFSTNKHFWGHIFWFPGVPVPVKLLMLPVELMGIFTKPFALMIRLFANMVAGHVIILSFIILIFIFGAMNSALGFGSSPIFIALAVFIYLIEVLVAFIQAYIFTNLTAVFISQAFEHGDHHDEHGHH